MAILLILPWGFVCKGKHTHFITLQVANLFFIVQQVKDMKAFKEGETKGSAAYAFSLLLALSAGVLSLKVLNF